MIPGKLTFAQVMIRGMGVMAFVGVALFMATDSLPIALGGTAATVVVVAGLVLHDKRLQRVLPPLTKITFPERMTKEVKVTSIEGFADLWKIGDHQASYLEQEARAQGDGDREAEIAHDETFLGIMKRDWESVAKMKTTFQELYHKFKALFDDHIRVEYRQSAAQFHHHNNGRYRFGGAATSMGTHPSIDNRATYWSGGLRVSDEQTGVSLLIGTRRDGGTTSDPNREYLEKTTLYHYFCRLGYCQGKSAGPFRLDPVVVYALVHGMTIKDVEYRFGVKAYPNT